MKKMLTIALLMLSGNVYAGEVGDQLLQIAQVRESAITAISTGRGGEAHATVNLVEGKRDGTIVQNATVERSVILAMASGGGKATAAVNSLKR